MRSRRCPSKKKSKLVRSQRRGRASKAPTIGPPLNLYQYSVIYAVLYEKMAICPPHLSAGDPPTLWHGGRPIVCFRRGDVDVLCRDTPLLHHDGIASRRLAMGMFGSCRKQAEKSRGVSPPVPGGFVGGPRASQDQFCGFKAHRVHARRDFSLHKQ